MLDLKELEEPKGPYCGSRLRSGELITYVGSIPNLNDREKKGTKGPNLLYIRGNLYTPKFLPGGRLAYNSRGLNITQLLRTHQNTLPLVSQFICQLGYPWLEL